MADEKCGLRYCNATVADYDEIMNIIKCPCMKCLGTNCGACDMYKKSKELNLDLQRQKCSVCKFYNGR